MARSRGLAALRIARRHRCRFRDEILGGVATGGGSRAGVMVMNTISTCAVTTKGASVTFIDLDDASSFDEMYRREYPALVAVASALSGEDGPDLVHDAMVKALVNWRMVRSFERPGGWCHRVVINLCRSRRRRRRTEQRYLEQQRGAYRSGTLCVEGPSVEAIAFWSAVRKLPERPRLAVALYYAGDRSVAEIAAILDVPDGTVKSDLSRARAVLAGELR